MMMVNKHDTHYTLGAGIPEFREKIAKKLQEENHINCTKDNILVTPGAKLPSTLPSVHC